MSIFLHGRFLAVLRAFVPLLGLLPCLCAARPLEVNSLIIKQLQMLKLLTNVKRLVYLDNLFITRMYALAPMNSYPRKVYYVQMLKNVNG